MEPIAALERIAYLLERSLAPDFKVKAFRKAAAILGELPPGEVEERARQGRLRSLPGVGEKTAAVVVQAVAGETPSYLAALEAEIDSQSGETDEAGIAIRMSLKGDCHSHSDWSDGGSPIETMARAARDLGHEYLVLTDHSPRLTVARGLTAERLRRQLDVVAEINERLYPFRILTGIEVDINLDGSLDQEEDLLASLDVVVASVHSKLRMDSPQMTARMIAAVRSPHVDILGHCTGRKVIPRPRPESTFDADAVFAACAETGTAVEINSRPERLDPPIRLLDKVVAAGCLVSIDTDAHAPGQLEWQINGCQRAARCQVPPDSIVNASPAEQIVAWARSHGP